MDKTLTNTTDTGPDDAPGAVPTPASLARFIANALSCLEEVARECIPGAHSLRISCDVSRTEHARCLGDPRTWWIIGAHMTPSHQEALAQGYGATFETALADTWRKAADMLGRCPTCGRKCDDACTAAPKTEEETR
jgi:hypothetical protein